MSSDASTVPAAGAWPTPLTPEALAAAGPRFEGARFVGDEIWWGESVPAEGGRTAVRRRSAGGAVADVLPAPLSARSKVHEYGGGSWTASPEGTLFFVSADDQRVWSLTLGGAPRPFTPATGGMRFGGLRYEHPEGAAPVLLAVRERHDKGAERHDIVEIALDGSAESDAEGLRVLASGDDFVAQPTLSPDGASLAYIAWNHPDMPWDAALLRVRTLVAPAALGSAEGSALAAAGDEPTVNVAGGNGSAVVQALWSGPDELLYADDPDGRWNLWRARVRARMAPLPVAPADADTGGPLWSLDGRWFDVLGDGRIVALRVNGGDTLWVIDPENGTERQLEVPIGARLNIEHTQGSRVLLTGAGVSVPNGVWLVDVDSGACEAIAGGSLPWPAEWVPASRPYTVEGRHGPVHAFLYPPTNPEVATNAAPAPFVVFVHGGPTGHVGGELSASVLHYTSRGIGVLDVNYGGSTGYGRAYRERLKGQWGVVDVDDVISAAQGLVEAGLADPARIAIEGGSAGGWTVLSALVASDVFSAGISRYGVGDARALAADTHGFESRYLDGLIGPLPDAEALYLERSPLTHAERITAPVLVLQGSDDAVVPPAQSEALTAALAANGVPHASRLYEGEGHGFRRRETVVDVFTSTIGFLAAVWGFDADGISPLELS